MKMKYPIIISIIIIIVVINAICTTRAKEKKEVKDTIVLEQWEYKVLVRYADEKEKKALETGQLLFYQKNYLEEIRRFKKYFEEKYPGKEIEINGIGIEGYLGASKYAITFNVKGYDAGFTGYRKMKQGEEYKDNFLSITQGIYDE